MNGIWSEKFEILCGERKRERDEETSKRRLLRKWETSEKKRQKQRETHKKKDTIREVQHLTQLLFSSARNLGLVLIFLWWALSFKHLLPPTVLNHTTSSKSRLKKDQTNQGRIKMSGSGWPAHYNRTMGRLTISQQRKNQGMISS
ncbi:hypothetical protein YC2023_059219 [Brassica napus]